MRWQATTRFLIWAGRSLRSHGRAHAGLASLGEPMELAAPRRKQGASSLQLARATLARLLPPASPRATPHMQQRVLLCETDRIPGFGAVGRRRLGRILGRPTGQPHPISRDAATRFRRQILLRLRRGPGTTLGQPPQVALLPPLFCPWPLRTWADCIVGDLLSKLEATSHPRPCAQR